MKFYLLFLLLLHTTLTNGWGETFLSPEEVTEKANKSDKFFEIGFTRHTFISIFQLQNSSPLQEFKIVELRNATTLDEISLKYSKIEKKIIFNLRALDEDTFTIWEVDFPEVEIVDDSWHEIIYRLGRKYFKLWLDCKIQRNSQGNFKTDFTFPPKILESFGKLQTTFEKEENVIYREKLDFHDHPNYSINDYYSGFQCHFDLKYRGKNESNIYFNGENKNGTFYALNEFVNTATKFNSPGIYYQLNKSEIRDVTEYFEDGVIRNHDFELIYRMKEFPSTNNSYYLTSLRSANSETIDLILNGLRNVLEIQLVSPTIEITRLEYLADQIYNNEWHVLKYVLKNKTFSLWIDNELMLDNLLRKEIPLVVNKEEDEQFLCYDTRLLVLDPEVTPIIDIRKIKYHGNAITTNNTKLSYLEPETTKLNIFKSFGKVLGRTFIG